MADWFKFYNDGLDEPRFQYAISEHSEVTSVWLVILSEASKRRSNTITWRDEDFELFGYAKKINVSVPILNDCLGLLERIEYITRSNGKITIHGWDKLQSDYAKGLDRGYYKHTSKTLASNSLDTSVRGEERRREEKRKSSPASVPESAAVLVNRPTLQEVITKASFIGLAPWKAEDWWNEMETCGWLDFNHRPVVKWEPMLQRVKAKWEADGRPKCPPIANGSTQKPKGRDFQP